MVFRRLVDTPAIQRRFSLLLRSKPAYTSSMKRLTAILLVPTTLLSATFGLTPTACADEFLLSGGGQVTGQLLNASEEPRTSYVVRTDDGLRLRLTEKQVRRHVPTSEARRYYEALLTKMPPDAEGNWKMAQWCRDAGLREEREFHLHEALRLDPDHRESRLALGYTTLDGEWVLTDEWNRRHGYVYHQGKWMTKQEVEVLTIAQRVDDLQNDYRPQLGRLRSVIIKNRDAQDVRNAITEIRAIKDPLAAEALAKMYEEEDASNPEIRAGLRLLWIETLANSNSGIAVDTIVKAAIEDESEQVREAAKDALERSKDRRAIGALLAELKSKDNAHVNRAGAALERIADPETMVPLMNALVTEHKFVVTYGRPGGTSAGFSPQGGSSFSAGSKAKVVTRNVTNTNVLSALRTIVLNHYELNANFQYDTEAWKTWFADLHAPEAVSFRRDP